MLENIKSFCERLDYHKDEGYWFAAIGEHQYYHADWEIYIAGDENGLNPALEKAAIRVLNNSRAVEPTVKAYLLQIKSTTFKPNNAVITLNNCPNTESLWKIMWLNFLDANKPD